MMDVIIFIIWHKVSLVLSFQRKYKFSWFLLFQKKERLRGERPTKQPCVSVIR